jgi:hypothetical protein
LLGNKKKSQSHPRSFKYSRIINSAVAPSPAAATVCFVDPARTLPAAKRPGSEVISVLSVTTNPKASVSTISFTNPLFAERPMNTNTPSYCHSLVSPVENLARRFPQPVTFLYVFHCLRILLNIYSDMKFAVPHKIFSPAYNPDTKQCCRL